MSRAAVIGAVAMAVALTGPAAEPAAAVLAPSPVAPINPVRLYTVRGVTKGGRPGPPAGRLELPLVAPPPVPPAPAAVETESSIVLTWIPPVTLGPIGFNVYKAGGSDPINASLITEPRYERAGVSLAPRNASSCVRLRKSRRSISKAHPLSRPASRRGISSRRRRRRGWRSSLAPARSI